MVEPNIRQPTCDPAHMPLWRAPVVVVRSLVVHRFLLYQMARRAFAARHAGSALGWMWSLLTTALQFALFWIVFGKIIGIRIAGSADVSLGVYLMVGLVPFLMISESVAGAAGLLRTQAALVQRVSFPLEVLIVGDTVGRVLHQVIALAIVIIGCCLLGTVSFGVLGWTLVGICLVLAWCLALSLVLALAGAVFPDVKEMLGLALLIAFYMAPIVYPLSIVPPGRVTSVIMLNPVTGLVQLIRAGLIGGEVPGWGTISGLCVGAVVIGLIGTFLLQRLRLRIPDLL